MTKKLTVSALLIAAAMLSASTGHAQQSFGEAYLSFLGDRISDRLNQQNPPQQANRGGNQQTNGGNSNQQGQAYNGNNNRNNTQVGQSNGGNYGLSRAASNSNQAIVQKLQDVLNTQARFGQNPGNNPLLAEVKKLIDLNTVASVTQIKVKNEGYAMVTVTQPNGIPINLYNGMEIPVNVGGGSIQIKASGNTQIRVTHIANGNCNFWNHNHGTQTILGTGWNAKTSHPVTLIANQTCSVSKS